MKKIHTKLLIGLILILTVLPLDIGTSTDDGFWEVGDWYKYEYIMAFVLQFKVTVIDTTPDYVEFMLNDNTSDTYKYNITDTTMTPFNMSQDPINSSAIPNKIFKVEPFFYNSNAIIHVDGDPIVIPVTGVIYEYSNISDTQLYNYTTYNFTYPYSHETTLVQIHTNYSVQFEFHEPTGFPINMRYTTYSNTTMSLFEIPLNSGWYMYLHDSHGVFDLSEEFKETTDTATTTTTTAEPTTTEYTTTEAITTNYATNFVSLSFIALVIVIMSVKRWKKQE